MTDRLRPTWEEALDVLEASARGRRALPFTPPVGRLPSHLRLRAIEVMEALRAAQAAVEADLARVGGELARLRGASAPPRSVDRSV